MKFIFIIGTEGSGHGMIRSLFKNYLNLYNVIDQGAWHAPLVALSDCCNESHYKSIYNMLQETLKEYKRNTHFADNTTLFESASFPFGQPRNAFRHPNISLLLNTLISIGITPKCLVLYRDPVDCVSSAVRRKFTDDVLKQAKIVKHNLSYIKSELNNDYFSSYYKCVDYDLFLDTPEDHIYGIKEWLEISQAISVSDLKKPTSKRIDSDNLSLFFAHQKQYTQEWVDRNYIGIL